MKALSIQQPWAWAILNAGKDIENRSWYTSFRGKFLIHVGKKIDVLGIGILNKDMDITCPTNLMTGGIVGVAEITDCVTESKSKWFFGRYGFVLQNPAPLPFMPYRGQLGFFDIDYKEPRAAQKNTKEDLQTATNTASLKCPLHEAGKMCRVFNSKPYKCDGPACIISGALQA